MTATEEINDQIEKTVERLGFTIGTTGDPNAGWPRAQGLATSVRPAYSFGDGISAVAVTPTFVQQWFRPYPWGHTDWRPVASPASYTSEAELLAALNRNVNRPAGMWGKS